MGFWILWCVLMAAFIFLRLYTKERRWIYAGRRPDWYLWPFYRRKVAGEEKRLQELLDDLCVKIGCRRYTVNVVVWSLVLGRFGAMPAYGVPVIFMTRAMAELLEDAPAAFVLAHELGHVLLATNDKYACDRFAAEHVTPRAGVAAIEATTRALSAWARMRLLCTPEERITALQKMVVN